MQLKINSVAEVDRGVINTLLKLVPMKATAMYNSCSPMNKDICTKEELLSAYIVN